MVFCIPSGGGFEGMTCLRFCGLSAVRFLIAYLNGMRCGAAGLFGGLTEIVQESLRGEGREERGT